VRTYYVYIMASASRVLYIGVTNNVEPFGNVRAAIAREKQLKGWLRAKKIALIESSNPRWKDLGAEWG